jgi:hypothetical protein
MNVEELANNSIKHLMAQDTTRDLAEAIAIAINNLKDKEGKFLRVRLSDDLKEHIDFCTQIAKQLRGEK